MHVLFRLINILSLKLFSFSLQGSTQSHRQCPGRALILFATYIQGKIDGISLLNFWRLSSGVGMAYTARLKYLSVTRSAASA